MLSFYRLGSLCSFNSALSSPSPDPRFDWMDNSLCFDAIWRRPRAVAQSVFPLIETRDLPWYGMCSRFCRIQRVYYMMYVFVMQTSTVLVLAVPPSFTIDDLCTLRGLQRTSLLKCRRIVDLQSQQHSLLLTLKDDAAVRVNRNSHTTPHRRFRTITSRCYRAKSTGV